jgi:hypothetical protein
MLKIKRVAVGRLTAWVQRHLCCGKWKAAKSTLASPPNTVECHFGISLRSALLFVATGGARKVAKSRAIQYTKLQFENQVGTTLLLARGSPSLESLV